MTMTPAGWYPDPWRAAPQRYWDGSQWTEHTGGTVAAGAKRYVYDARRGRTAMRLGQWSMGLDAGIAAFTVVTTISAAALYAANPDFADDVATGDIGGLLLLIGILGLFSLLLLAATITALVLRIVWAWRIAANGAALGIPAQLTPGWAIGSWFIPIANLFLPYQAIRDSVPRDRKLPVLRWWLVLVFANVSGFGIRLSSQQTSPGIVMTLAVIAAVFAVVGCALSILAAIWGIPLARRINEVQAEIAAQQGLTATSAYTAAHQQPA